MSKSQVQAAFGREIKKIIFLIENNMPERPKEFVIHAYNWKGEQIVLLFIDFGEGLVSIDTLVEQSIIPLELGVTLTQRLMMHWKNIMRTYSYNNDIWPVYLGITFEFITDDYQWEYRLNQITIPDVMDTGFSISEHYQSLNLGELPALPTMTQFDAQKVLEQNVEAEIRVLLDEILMTMVNLLELKVFLYRGFHVFFEKVDNSLSLKMYLRMEDMVVSIENYLAGHFDPSETETRLTQFSNAVFILINKINHQLSLIDKKPGILELHFQFIPTKEYYYPTPQPDLLLDESLRHTKYNEFVDEVKSYAGGS